MRRVGRFVPRVLASCSGRLDRDASPGRLDGDGITPLRFYFLAGLSYRCSGVWLQSLQEILKTSKRRAIGCADSRSLGIRRAWPYREVAAKSLCR